MKLKLIVLLMAFSVLSFAQNCVGKDFFFENVENVSGDTLTVTQGAIVNPCYFSIFDIHRRLFVYREGRRLHYGQSGDIGYKIEDQNIILNQPVHSLNFLVYQLPDK